MDFFFLVPLALIAAIGGRFVWGRVRYGSWAGSFLKGSIVDTTGEVSTSHAMGVSQKIQVHSMRATDSDESFVGMVVVSKAPFSASMQPFRLSRDQALELSNALSRAAK